MAKKGTTVKFELHKLYVGHGTKADLPHMGGKGGKGGAQTSGHIDPWKTKKH